VFFGGFSGLIFAYNLEAYFGSGRVGAPYLLGQGEKPEKAAKFCAERPRVGASRPGAWRFARRASSKEITMRRFAFSLALAMAASSLAAVSLAKPAPTSFPVNGPAGVIGAVVLEEGPTGVLMSVNAAGLQPGWHGMHLHEHGDCSDAGFKAAGGHINHGGKHAHGLLAAGGPETGDLPNIYVAADGVAHAEVFLPQFSLHGANGKPALMDKGGSALIIHANHDDQTSQPIGGAGARVACAALR
jgi:Cu-Zn family superoxide dismutase